MIERVSLQDIADSLGISRGTVDRAIHNRGRISEATRERVLVEARRLGYIDNRLNPFLSLRDGTDIAVLIPAGDAFFGNIEEGIRKAAAEMETSPNLRFVHISLEDTPVQTGLLQSLTKENSFSGILIVPSDDPELCSAIDECEAAGIRVAALNTDAPGSRRSFFVGQDLYASGRVAAELMLRINRGPVAVLSGYENVWAHRERVRGFTDVFREKQLEGRLLGPFYTHDSAGRTRSVMKDFRESDAGVYSVSGLTTENSAGFLRDFGRESVSLVGFDCTEANISLLEAGYISFLISQSPQLQGYLALRRLIGLIRDGTSPVREETVIPIDIYVRENIRFYRNHLEI